MSKKYKMIMQRYNGNEYDVYYPQTTIDQVENLDSTLKTISSQASGTSTKVDALEGTVTTLSGNVSVLEGTVTTLSGNVSTLTTQVAGKQDKLTIDTYPSKTSGNVVTGSGIITYVDNTIAAALSKSY